jgi:pimeloyl-ACP methyl ester carboxylesterase
LIPASPAERTITIIELARRGRFDDIRDLFLEQLRPMVSADALRAELPFGVPAAYWLDLRSYQPAEVAARLDKPVLVLQGGRDYQATVDEDLATWRRALNGRPDVSIRIYPADNHFFFRGSGPSAPAESEAAQHVDPQVVLDMAEWVNTGQLSPWFTTRGHEKGAART